MYINFETNKRHNDRDKIKSTKTTATVTNIITVWTHSRIM